VASFSGPSTQRVAIAVVVTGGYLLPKALTLGLVLVVYWMLYLKRRLLSLRISRYLTYHELRITATYPVDGSLHYNLHYLVCSE